MTARFHFTNTKAILSNCFSSIWYTTLCIVQLNMIVFCVCNICIMSVCMFHPSERQSKHLKAITHNIDFDTRHLLRNRYLMNTTTIVGFTSRHKHTRGLFLLVLCVVCRWRALHFRFLHETVAFRRIGMGFIINMPYRRSTRLSIGPIQARIACTK